MLTQPSRGVSDGGGAPAFAFDLLGAAQKNALATMVVQLAASLTMPVLGRVEARGWYLAWLALVLLIFGARIFVERRLGRLLKGPAAADQLAPWAIAHSAGLIFSSGLWALLAWIQLPAETVQTQFFIIIVVSALAAGATGILAPLKTTGRIYITLMLAPASLRLMLDGDMALGVLGLVFCGVMIASHRNSHALLLRSIALGRENLGLVSELRARNDEIEQINQSLEQRVADRTKALELLAIEAQAGSRAKSEFLSTISHEIRTPLNGVLGMAQVMERGELTAPQRERLSIIQTSALTLLGVVNDVLDISKIEAGNMTLNPAEFLLAPFADGIRRLYGVLAEEKGLTFDLSLGEAASGMRFGDEVRLRQIVSNLISNALKFTAAGAISVGIGGDADGITIEVRDTGAGIAPEDQVHVFDRFVQADGSNTRRAGGTGLGLAICRELTELMGGEISLVSAPGEGSCFTVRLPMPVRGARPPVSALPPTEPPRPAVKGARVLVVDDNPTNRLVLQTMLEDFGLSTGMAHDGVEAVSAWESGEWDAILMDIHMPRMDGLDATRVIRARETGVTRARTPIIAVTASVLSHETAAYRAAGMDEVVAKPVESQILMDALSRQKAGSGV
ncbi:ATP-binding protein [Phenylobacterium sp.]|uniref:ATP-binding protein n=1 Tax=Phenylobacterium sp. TaxID=1871053 RepID=UPI002716C474|nr:ATP-binding protein [Phenylobacterium sp.]MDO8802272.1 ATP-binding protein [Phenylobacterium sp.]